MSSYQVHSRVDNVRINKKFKNKQSGYRPNVCQYGDIWTPEAYPSKCRRSKKNIALRKYYAQWVDCELKRDADTIIEIDHEDYDDIPVWTCDVCTYINMERLAFCCMCNHALKPNLTRHNITQTYQFKPSKPKKRARKRKRKRTKKTKLNSRSSNFESYWQQMSNVKQYQPTLNYSESGAEPSVPPTKIYISKIVIMTILKSMSVYNGSTQVWETRIKINDRDYKLTMYQTTKANKYYDITNIKHIPIVFDASIFPYFKRYKLVNVAKNEVYAMLLKKMKGQNCPFSADTFPADTFPDRPDKVKQVGIHARTAVRLSYLSTVASASTHSAKYYREEAKENEQRYTIYRNRFENNKNEMRIKIRFLLLESMLQDAIVNFDVLADDGNAKHFDYECHSVAPLSIDSRQKLDVFHAAQSCFNCNHPFRDTNTVVWSEYNRYSLLQRDATSDRNVENTLYLYVPCDIARHVLKYLYYDSVMIVEGFVKKPWINFVGGNGNYDARLFAYRDSKGNVNYYSPDKFTSLTPMTKGNIWFELDLEKEWPWQESSSSDWESSSCPIPNLFGDSSDSHGF